MKEFRKGKDVTEHYTSFAEMAKAWGCAPVEKKRTKNADKLKAQREKFLGTCPICQSANKFVSPQYIVCSNVDCKGKNIAPKGEEPRYVLSMRELNEKGIEIASHLFD